MGYFAMIFSGNGATPFMLLYVFFFRPHIFQINNMSRAAKPPLTQDLPRAKIILSGIYRVDLNY